MASPTGGARQFRRDSGGSEGHRFCGPRGSPHAARGRVVAPPAPGSPRGAAASPWHRTDTQTQKHLSLARMEPRLCLPSLRIFPSPPRHTTTGSSIPSRPLSIPRSNRAPGSPHPRGQPPPTKRCSGMLSRVPAAPLRTGPPSQPSQLPPFLPAAALRAAGAARAAARPGPAPPPRRKPGLGAAPGSCRSRRGRHPPGTGPGTAPSPPPWRHHRRCRRPAPAAAGGEGAAPAPPRGRPC